MEDKNFGNRITANTFKADDGSVLIDNALNYIKKQYSWFPINGDTLFKGVYYDSQKVGSYIIKVRNKKKEKAILKLQLRPLPFDEGFIIRHIQKYNKSKKIRTPIILADKPWNKKLGFGYLIFEDLSAFPNIWKSNIITNNDRLLHGQFLKEFLNKTLPIRAWIEKPKTELNILYKKTFKHFEEIADKSNHRHIKKSLVNNYKNIYFKIIDNFDFEDVHFTHAHLSGKDVKYNKSNNSFIILANLYWSYRPNYYELTFPIWVDIMHIRDEKITLNKILNRLNKWNKIWQTGIYERNPINTQQYWFNLVERAMLTIMLDLGASEWHADELNEKQALLNAWQRLFDWITKEKFNLSIKY